MLNQTRTMLFVLPRSLQVQCLLNLRRDAVHKARSTRAALPENNEASAELTIANGGTFTSSSARLSSKLELEVNVPSSAVVSLSVATWFHTTWIWGTVYRIYSVSQKVAPLKLFAVFSLLVNLCNWKLSWLMPKHIPMSIPILVHLSEYLCEMYHFYRCDPSNFKNSI